MSDTIRLKRSISGEFAPRFYTVSGKNFDEMLQAVKALPFRKFESYEKVWLVKGDGLKTLEAQGLIVEQEPDLRHEFVEGSIEDLDQMYGVKDKGVRVTVYPQIRNGQGWEKLPYLTIKFQVTDEQVEAEKEAINEAVRKAGMNFLPAERYQAIRAIARREVNIAFDKLVILYNQATSGKRDEATVEAALVAAFDEWKR